MAEAGIEELAVKLADPPADPGLLPVEARRGAAGDHPIEVPVDVDLEKVRAHRAGQALGDVKGIERNDPALARLDPEQGRIVRILSHGEDAGRIGLQQNLGRDFNRVVGRPGHSPTYPIVRLLV